jgi:hypothetical protein
VDRRPRLSGAGFAGRGCGPVPSSPVSKKTDKRKQKARKNKANHGSKPNAGRS